MNSAPATATAATTPTSTLRSRLRDAIASGYALRLATSATALVSIIQLALFISASTLAGWVSVQENAALGPGYCALIQSGAKFSPFIIAREESYRILSALFLHSGLLPLLITFVLQFSIMLPVELVIGRAVALFVFVLCGVCGHALSMIGSPLGVDMGAMGGIFGLIGFQISKRILDPYCARKITTMDVVAVLAAILLGQIAHVDNYATFAGFCMGAFLGGLYYCPTVADVESPFLNHLVGIVSAASAGFILFICFFLPFGAPYTSIDQLLWPFVCAQSTIEGEENRVPFF